MSWLPCRTWTRRLLGTYNLPPFHASPSLEVNFPPWAPNQASVSNSFFISCVSSPLESYDFFLACCLVVACAARCFEGLIAFTISSRLLWYCGMWERASARESKPLNVFHFEVKSIKVLCPLDLFRGELSEGFLVSPSFWDQSTPRGEFYFLRVIATRLAMPISPRMLPLLPLPSLFQFHFN